jgi:hypothetical protein
VQGEREQTVQQRQRLDVLGVHQRSTPVGEPLEVVGHGQPPLPRRRLAEGVDEQRRHVAAGLRVQQPQRRHVVGLLHGPYDVERSACLRQRAALVTDLEQGGGPLHPGQHAVDHDGGLLHRPLAGRTEHAGPLVQVVAELPQAEGVVRRRTDHQRGAAVEGRQVLILDECHRATGVREERAAVRTPGRAEGTERQCEAEQSRQL